MYVCINVKRLDFNVSRQLKNDDLCDATESILVRARVCVFERRGLINGLSLAVSFRWDVFPKQGLNIYHVHP